MDFNSFDHPGGPDDGLFKGAPGTAVLVDTRRRRAGFRAIEETERQNVPFVVALTRHLKERSAVALELP
jgi:signal recognition particle receptor subunit beta